MYKSRCYFLRTILIVCIISFCSAISYAQTYGLKFQGHDVTLDKRTELNLTPNDFLKIEDEFEISFSIKLDVFKPGTIFGYIFRIISEENKNIDLLSTPTPVNELNLVIGNSNTVVPINYPSNYENKWVNLRIKFFLQQDKVVFYTPDTFYVQNNIGFKKTDAFKLIFGANDYQQFKTTDVPSINIRDVKIYEKGKLTHHWPLDSKRGTVAYDIIKNEKAVVKNPNWLKLSHQAWNTELDSELEGYFMTAIDELNERIFFIGINELNIFSFDDKSLITKEYTNQPPFINDSYRSFYNKNDGKIYAYLIDSEEGLASLDVETATWSGSDMYPEIETKFRHHNRYFDAEENSIYLFGGYGFHTYNNTIFKIDLNEPEITTVPTNDSVFLPRYLAGLGALNDTVYIFGGYGSETGNQIINPHSYYDFIGYSLKDSNFFKKFDVPQIIDDMAVANSMWVNAGNRNYYALIFEKSLFDGYLQLVRGNLDSPEIENVGNKIPFQFLDIRSTAGLFFLPGQNKLFAFTTYLTESQTTNVAVYSISFPPDKFEETSILETKNTVFWIVVVIIAVLLGAAFTIYSYFRRKRKKQIVEP
ncbi:MAG TPA: hypothetical protein VKA10_09805, partial [Prolixibacteraceae bacterium]|nr:hypothetical protein [Prolixibacteraceae bacterium]